MGWMAEQRALAGHMPAGQIAHQARAARWLEKRITYTGRLVDFITAFPGSLWMRCLL